MRSTSPHCASAPALCRHSLKEIIAVQSLAARASQRIIEAAPIAISKGVSMRKWVLVIITLLLSFSVDAADNGIVSKPSGYSVPETLDRLETVVRAKGFTVFARIDHTREAERVGLQMRPTQLLIFGNPKAGTALMNSSPSIAIDLPLKALAWEDQNGKVWLSYNSADYLKQRHNLKEEFMKNLAAAEILIDEALK
jgi:uncharacterized protein (DUF302 family)